MSHKKILLAAVILTLTIYRPVFAGSNLLINHQPGFYLGAGAGYARTVEGSGPEDYINQFFGSKNTEKRNIGGRFYFGYNFSPYFSLETGYAIYPNNRYRATNREVEIKKVRDLDFAAKGIFPLEHLSAKLNGWQLFGKLGIAALRSEFNVTNNNNHKKTKTLRARPFYGLGIGYNFNNHFGVDLSWLGVYSKDKINAKEVSDMSNDVSSINNKVPSVNLVAIGLSYKF